nr:LutB/LldF family L-lactate oxidation iron-sulfur protein [Paludisphaera rhizosphaerae]
MSRREPTTNAELMSREGVPPLPVSAPAMPFQDAARLSLGDTQLRFNMGKATTTIRAKRYKVVDEMPDWQNLREAGRAIKDRTLRHLDKYLIQLEESVTRVGGKVHWAADAEDANRIVAGIVKSHGAKEVVKIKSLTTDEIGLNEALAHQGIKAYETDLAELIIQLADERSSHILVPAIHKSRAEIREIFRRTLENTEHLGDEPKELAAAARAHLRRKFLTVPVAVSGVNFGVADTGTICIVESEGNGRMCLTLPKVLVSVMGIEKLVPTWRDLEVFLQLLPRSSTAERMNPYTSFWTGIAPPGDGPDEFHLILLDDGRSKVLADRNGRQALHCIRCSACLNICPVYERTGGHAYNSVYPGPIGAILTPQLVGVENAGSLPYASSLCGACYEVCPVKINIPEVLLHLRGEVVRHKQATLAGKLSGENIAMQTVARVFASPRRYEAAQKAGRLGQKLMVKGGVIERLPGQLGGWTAVRDVYPIAPQTFREWWKQREKVSNTKTVPRQEARP